MPFILYSVEESGGLRTFTREREVELAGASGPIAAVARRHLQTGRVAWHAGARDLLAAVPGARTMQELVFDLKPKDQRAVSLYRLLDLWGYSYDIYTPLALRLECLFTDRDVVNPRGFKNHFTDQEAHRTILAEFLYINGGTRRGGWTWGLSGRVNGALLWREAYSYFTKEIEDSLSNRMA